MTNIANESSGNGTIAVYDDNGIGSNQYLFRLNSINKASEKKNISLLKSVVNNVTCVSIIVRNIANNSSSTGGGGTGGLAPPAGFNENYDIIREANLTRIFKQEIEAKAFTPNFVKDAQKLFYFGLMMAPKSFYDLKTNSEWLSSQEAGNYNYGYLGAAMGIQQETLLQLSGMVQFASDTVSSGGDYPYVFNLGKGILDGDFGQFDNLPEDPEEIIAGYQAHEDGCEPDTNASNNPTSSSGSSAGGGWSSSFRLFVGASRCVGNCDIPSGTVTVTDLDPE